LPILVIAASLIRQLRANMRCSRLHSIEVECLVVADTADTTVVYDAHDRFFYLPTKDLAPFSIHKPQSRFARLWLDMIIAESDAATQLTTPDA